MRRSPHFPGAAEGDPKIPSLLPKMHLSSSGIHQHTSHICPCPEEIHPALQVASTHLLKSGRLCVSENWGTPKAGPRDHPVPCKFKGAGSNLENFQGCLENAIRDETDGTPKAVLPQFLKKKRFNLRYRRGKGPDLIRMADLIQERIPGWWKRNGRIHKAPPEKMDFYTCVPRGLGRNVNDGRNASVTRGPAQSTGACWCRYTRVPHEPCKIRGTNRRAGFKEAAPGPWEEKRGDPSKR